MKVMSFNVGSFLGYEGTRKDYLTKPWRSITGTGNEKDYLDELVRIVKEQSPDQVLLQEIDNGSFRTRTSGQHKYLSNKLDYHSNFCKKYRGIVFPRAPLLRFLGSSVFYNEGKVKNHRLDTGRKNLVQEVKLDDLSIFSVHLARIMPEVREKQLEQISQIVDRRKNYVVSGDFNFQKGEQEVEKMKEILGCDVVSPGRTFPASHPEKKLDMVAKSKNLEIKRCERLEEKFSDHRPIVFEI